MNVGGHIVVAASVAPEEPVVWLGAALPDLGAMGRFRLLGSTPDPEVTRGIAMHHRTDDVFHSHPWFTGLMSRLRASLKEAGLDRGAARAIAHVGPELLLDGELLRRPGQTDAVDTTIRLLDEPELRARLRSLVSPDMATDWIEHLASVAGHPSPPDHHDPHAVAQRLHRILRRRPRLAFDADQVAAAAACLDAEHERLLSGVDELMSDLIRDVSAPGT